MLDLHQIALVIHDLANVLVCPGVFIEQRLCVVVPGTDAPFEFRCIGWRCAIPPIVESSSRHFANRTCQRRLSHVRIHALTCRSITTT